MSKTQQQYRFRELELRRVLDVATADRRPGARRRPGGKSVRNESLRVVLEAGVGLGLAGARVLSLMGAVPFDSTTFASFTGTLAAAALLAVYVPARRALRVDPALALGAE